MRRLEAVVARSGARLGVKKVRDCEVDSPADRASRAGDRCRVSVQSSHLTAPTEVYGRPIWVALVGDLSINVILGYDPVQAFERRFSVTLHEYGQCVVPVPNAAAALAMGWIASSVMSSMSYEL